MTPETFSEFAKIFPEPIILVTTNGEILSANNPFLKIISNTRETLSGRNLAEISFTEEEKLLKYLQNCSRSQQMLLGALDLRNAAGEKVQFRCEGAVVESSHENNPAKIFMRFRAKESADSRFIILRQKIDQLNKEIFERKRAEAETRKLHQEAEEASRLKDEFLATISHELRTPLNTIQGWAGMLRKGRLKNDDFEKALETIERNARSQTKLVEDLLDVSRIITGKLRLDVRPVEIASLIQTAVEMLRPTAENKSIRLEIIIDPQAGLISGDLERLQQVMWNLLSNAIKFTPKDGRVQIRLERVNSHIEIVVSDTGAGIEPDFLPYVFDRFRQADSSKTRIHGGLGLGLAITRHLVELHGGSIHVFSKGKDTGATFTIKLPKIIVTDAERFPDEIGKRTHPTALEDSIKQEIRPVLEKLHLLVVDDEPDARELLQFLLKDYGAEVELAASVAEALEKLQTSDFDILISDIEMPNQTGFTLIEKVRTSKNENMKDIAAVALTAHARTSDRLQILSAGFDFHLAKPFEPAELIAVIVSLARRTK